MAAKFDAAAYNFRKKCPYVSKDLLRWFPGHMNKGLKQMQRKLKSVDCVIEVHDARIPFTGRNPIFTSTLTGAKPHVLVLNKQDLTVRSLIPKIKDQLKSEEGVQNVVFTNCKDQHCRGLKTLRPLMIDIIKGSNRYNRSEELDYNVMIIGVPNVGILEPSVTNIEMGLKLALCASLQDHLVGEEIIADYLLYWLNSHGNFKYVEYMGLTEPCDDINKVLISGALKFNRVRRTRDFDGRVRDVPDITEVARTMIRAFRVGELGKTLLDIDLLKRDREKVQEVLA